MYKRQYIESAKSRQNKEAKNNIGPVSYTHLDVYKRQEYGFQVGDTKEIILNGIVGSCELSNYQTRAFIIGINHNAELEGNNLIHLQVGLGMLTGGSDIGIALVDDEVNYSGSSPAFRITTTTVMGMTWGQSYMRNSRCV